MRGWVVAGDVVTSRRFVDRDRLLDGLVACLAVVNEAVPALEPLHIVSEDEFRGAYSSLSDVLLATVRLRVVTDELVLGTVDGEDEPADVRVGIAVGSLDDAGRPDEPTWALAAGARAQAQELPARAKWPPSLRTVVAGSGEHVATVNAYLLLQDQLLARMDARDRRALVGLLDDERQVDIADDLGVTQPAVARRVRDRGALAITRALRVLQGDD